MANNVNPEKRWRFSLDHPNFSLSPMTGMTRGHWVECARHILTNIFTYVEDADSVFEFPNVPGVSYPQPGAPAWQHRSKRIEGFRRTMCVAGPMMHVEPGVSIKGIGLANYYRSHLVRLLRPGNEEGVPLPDELDGRIYQFTCELGGLCQILLQYPDQFWPMLTDAERESTAEMLYAWGHYPTYVHNWRWFNIMILTFLKVRGYDVDDDLLQTHLDFICSFHAGDGWYHDGHIDYYSAYVFHMYPIIWNRVYGREHEPERAALFEQRFAAFMRHYPRLFGRDGQMLMWGRSTIYRSATVSVFPLASLAQERVIDPGWARHITSSTLLQFVSREDFWMDGIPSLGFYRHWETLVQNYSSSGSPLWMFLPFIALSLPEDDPFWTAPENDGPWSELGDTPATTSLPGPGLHLTNFGRTGASELRPSKVRTSDRNYHRLAYNTAFPWEAESMSGATPMAYSRRELPCAGRADLKHDEPLQLHREVLGGYTRDGVLYRHATLTAPTSQRTSGVDLAEVIIPWGVVRLDRCRVHWSHELYLGHFGLPITEPSQVPVIERYRRGTTQAVAVYSGSFGLALTMYCGWDELEVETRSGQNPVSAQSIICSVRRKREAAMPGMEWLVTAMLHRTDGRRWNEQELFPIDESRMDFEDGSLTMKPLNLFLRDGSEFYIDLDVLDAHLL